MMGALMGALNASSKYLNYVIAVEEFYLKKNRNKRTNLSVCSFIIKNKIKYKCIICNFPHPESHYQKVKKHYQL